MKKQLALNYLSSDDESLSSSVSFVSNDFDDMSFASSVATTDMSQRGAGVYSETDSLVLTRNNLNVPLSKYRCSPAGHDASFDEGEYTMALKDADSAPRELKKSSCHSLISGTSSENFTVDSLLIHRKTVPPVVWSNGDDMSMDESCSEYTPLNDDPQHSLTNASIPEAIVTKTTRNTTAMRSRQADFKRGVGRHVSSHAGRKNNKAGSYDFKRGVSRHRSLPASMTVLPEMRSV